MIIITEAKGLLLAALGALYSLFFMPWYLLIRTQELEPIESMPQAYNSMMLFTTIVQWMCIIGGIIILVGVAISIGNAGIGWKVILAGAIVGGGNVLAIVAAIVFIRPRKKRVKYNVSYTPSSSYSMRHVCYECGAEIPLNESKCEACKNKTASMFD